MRSKEVGCKGREETAGLAQEAGDQGARYLRLAPAVAANGPQELQRPPEQDGEEAAEESHHGGGQESPPHALAVAPHLHGHLDDKRIHLGLVDEDEEEEEEKEEEEEEEEDASRLRWFAWILLLILTAASSAAATVCHS